VYGVGFEGETVISGEVYRCDRRPLDLNNFYEGS
jgi:hypothetical protein